MNAVCDIPTKEAPPPFSEAQPTLWSTFTPGRKAEICETYPDISKRHEYEGYISRCQHKGEAPSEKGLITRFESATLRRSALVSIIGSVTEPIFRHRHLNREVIIGLVGHRGGGKSGSGSVIAIHDGMLSGFTVFSNMSIAFTMQVEDALAREAGMAQGGTVLFRSRPLDKVKLLEFDRMYARSYIFVDEINVEFADARRSMSNSNLLFNRTGQELRHIESNMIFTVLDEMSIDMRLRENTDIFVKCADRAFTSEGLAGRMECGVFFDWKIYAMSPYLRGSEGSYYATHKAVEGYSLNFKQYRGIYDDKEVQASGRYKYGIQLNKKTNGEDKQVMAAHMQMQESPVVSGHKGDWGWFEPIARKWLRAGALEVWAKQIMDEPEVQEHQGLLPARRWQQLVTEELTGTYGVKAKHREGQGTVYKMPKSAIPELV